MSATTQVPVIDDQETRRRDLEDKVTRQSVIVGKTPYGRLPAPSQDLPKIFVHTDKVNHVGDYWVINGLERYDDASLLSAHELLRVLDICTEQIDLLTRNPNQRKNLDRQRNMAARFREAFEARGEGLHEFYAVTNGSVAYATAGYYFGLDVTISNLAKLCRYLDISVLDLAVFDEDPEDPEDDVNNEGEDG